MSRTFYIFQQQVPIFPATSTLVTSRLFSFDNSSCNNHRRLADSYNLCYDLLNGSGHMYIDEILKAIFATTYSWENSRAKPSRFAIKQKGSIGILTALKQININTWI